MDRLGKPARSHHVVELWKDVFSLGKELSAFLLKPIKPSICGCIVLGMADHQRCFMSAR